MTEDWITNWFLFC